MVEEKDKKDKQISARLNRVYDEFDIKPYTPLLLSEQIIEKLSSMLTTQYFDSERHILVISDCSLLIAVCRLLKNSNTKAKISFLCHTKKQKAFAAELLVPMDIYYLPYTDISKTTESFFNREFKNMKFDVIIANPPYQAPERNGTKKGGSSITLWPRFVKKSMEYLNEDGYLAMIHPCGWRAPNNELWRKLSTRQILYLDIHSEYTTKESGMKTFGVGTNYDWYVLKNSENTMPTVVNDMYGKEYELNLTKWPWLPNAEFTIIDSLLSGDINTDIIHDGKYSTGNKRISLTKTKKFNLPIFLGLNNKTKEINVCFSSENVGHFGIPKVLCWGSRYVYCAIDLEGKYGINVQSFGIAAASIDIATEIKRAIESNAFRQIIKSTKWSNFQTNCNMFKYFKKDFYKTILEEEEKLKNAK